MLPKHKNLLRQRRGSIAECAEDSFARRSGAQIAEGSPGLAGAGGGGAGPVAGKRRRTTCAGMQPSRRGEAHARRVVAAPPPPAPAGPGRLRESLEPRINLANEHLHAFDGLVMAEEPKIGRASCRERV